MRNYEVIAYFGLHVYTCFILDISIVIILTLFNKELFFMLIYFVMVVKKSTQLKNAVSKRQTNHVSLFAGFSI